LNAWSPLILQTLIQGIINFDKKNLDVEFRDEVKCEELQDVCEPLCVTL